MLAVDIDQHFAQCTQVLLWAWRAVDIATRTTFGGNHAAQYYLVIVLLQVAVFQPLLCFGYVANIEGSEYVGFVSSGAHGAAIRTATQGQCQRVEHDRFAGAGFAGYNAHTAAQLQLKMVDNGVIIDRKVYQHDSRSLGKCSGYLYSSLLCVDKCRLKIGMTCLIPLEALNCDPI